MIHSTSPRTLTLADAGEKLEAWRNDYNEVRQHGAHDFHQPAKGKDAKIVATEPTANWSLGTLLYFGRRGCVFRIRFRVIATGLDDIINAPRCQVMVQGDEYRAWQEVLSFCARGYCNAFARGVDRIPLRKDYKTLIESVEILTRAMAPFGEHPNSQLPVSIGFQLYELQRWSSEELARKPSGGRHANGLYKKIVTHLLLLYVYGYERKPSRSPDGPTYRFVEAFMDSLRGTEVEMVDDWRSEDEEEPFRRRVSVPQNSRIPDIIRKCLPGLSEEVIPAWWEERGLNRGRFIRLLAK